MRIIFTPLVLILFFVSSAQDGDLDVFNYGSSGKSVTNSSPLPITNEQQRIFILTSNANKILHSFTFANGSNDEFGLVRYNADGSIDNTFGSSGYVTNNFGGDDHAYGMTVNASSQILQVGTTINAGVGSFAIARYNSNGALDNSFDLDGRVITSIGDDAKATSVIQNGSVIYVGGTSLNHTSGNYEFTLARYQVSNGASLGVTTTAIGAAIGTVDQINSLALQDDGKIVAAGSTSTGGVTKFALVRYNSDGSLDAAFGTSGIVTTQVLTNNDAANDVAVQGTGTNHIIVAVGSADNGTNTDFAVTRYTDNGTLDNTFNTNGKKTIAVGSTNDVAYSTVIQPDGKILVAGTTMSTTNDFAITRLNTDGSIDAANFGVTTPGFTIIDFSGSSNDWGYDIALGSGYIMFGGYSNNALATARLTNSSVVLPVHITTFTASKSSKSVAINWQSANEEDVRVYEIERSSDGIHFSNIGSVAATNNGNYLKNYAFEDKQPSSINFYRLKIVNKNNSVENSKIVVVRFENNTSLQAFPNPLRNSLNLQITQPKGTIKLQLFDMSGRMVKAFELESNGTTISTSIDVSNLVKGVYLLKANDQAIKLMKE